MNDRGPATAWHVPDLSVQAYADGSLPEPDCWSLEKHVETCTGCAQRISDAVRAGSATVARSLDATRAGLLATLDMPVAEGKLPSFAAETSTGRISRGAWIAWAAGPALRGSWVAAVVLVATVAVLFGYAGQVEAARPLLLAVAPVLPVVGVALSYGRPTDPMHEIAMSTPSGGLRMLLVRSAAVLGASAPLVTVGGLLLPAAPGTPGAGAWLLPGLTLTLATLALGSRLGCPFAAAVVGAGWTLAVLVSTTAVSQRAGQFTRSPAEALSLALSEILATPAAQSAWAAATVACTGLIALHRSSFDHLERM